MKVSIVIPAYNSRNLLPRLLQQIKNVNFGKLRTEIIVVDDCSPDKTYETVKHIKGITLIRHKKNTGKGGAMRDGFLKATGDIFYIQDDDLEYDPADIPLIVKTLVDRHADACFGSRHLNRKNNYSSLLYRLGGQFIDSLMNVYLGTHLSDSLTGAKAFTINTYNKIAPIESTGFELESELVAKMAKHKLKIVEVPIHYYPRTHKQGKNIRWYHAFCILMALRKYK